MPSLKLFGIALATGTVIAASGIANAQTTQTTVTTVTPGATTVYPATAAAQTTTITSAPTPTDAVTYPPSPRPLMVPATLVQSGPAPATTTTTTVITPVAATTTAGSPPPESMSSVTLLASKEAPGAVEALPESGRDAFQTYLGLALPKAFAVDKENKAYGYIGGVGDVQSAELEAVKRCSAVSSAGDCKVISVNELPTVAMNGSAVVAPDAINSASETRSKSIAEYTQASGPKALATSPGGAWGWVSGSKSVDEARNQALTRCSGWGDNCTIAEASAQ